ncbi:MAG: alkaline phosphatase family protein [Planctomycetota bacterium]
MKRAIWCLALLPLVACAKDSQGGSTASHKRVVVLGIDGLDPDLLQQAIERFPERMGNFRRLIGQGGGIRRLETSYPPQSPVAWSCFITGRNPGGHGVYDFIHRDPKTYREVPGTLTPMESSPWPLPGPWQLPSTHGGESHRSGKAFWSVLGDAGVPCDVWRMPINFPVEPGRGLSMSGMLTPAIDSAYGQPTLYSTNPPLELLGDSKSVRIDVRSGRVRTVLLGPDNPFRDDARRSTAPLDLFVDDGGRGLALELGGQSLVLVPGQWSRFLKVEFPLLPGGAQKVRGIVRFYLRSLSPELELYASPVNIDPEDPASPITDPGPYSAELAQAIGPYYTQGMAEDVNGLKKGFLDDEEFMAQTQLVFRERGRMLETALDRYMASDAGGVLFFYYSTVDLCGHMIWRLGDPAHPDYDPELSARDSSWWSGCPGSTWQDVLVDLYLRMDPILGRIREQVGEDTLILVMSDHGFAPFHRLFSLNRWLYEQGYLVLKPGLQPEVSPDDPDFRPVVLADAVDWSKTVAYGMGFNGLYLNLRGREAQGIVEPGESANALLEKLKGELEALRDDAPERRGTQIVLHADRADAVYSGARSTEAPDLVVGYNAGYGNSDESSLGRIPFAVLRDNLGGTFNGNHLMHPSVVQGTLITNGVPGRGVLGLEDVTAELFRQYDVTPPEAIDGTPFLE